MDATRRSAKYGNKVSGDVTKNRIDAQAANMKSNFTATAGENVQVETDTKALLTGWGVSVTLHASYLSYAREIMGITHRHTGVIAENEACLACKKWGDALRGLTMYYLQVIALDVFNIDVSACT
ncbi:MAG: hypothetical protein WC475_01715 [Candidatus Paceibacterota bacterium]